LTGNISETPIIIVISMITMYNMIIKLGCIMRELGLEVLDIFEEKLEAREEQASHIFNSNKKYLYLPDDAEITPISPFYGFTLIPDITKHGIDSTSNITYLLQFINWSIYFYNELKSSYEAIESSKEILSSEKFISYTLANMIDQISPNEQVTKVTHEQIENDARNRLSKNHAVLKPSKFLQLCRFFTRAWFDENFGVEGSRKFAHYIGCYIQNSLLQPTVSKCKYYKANSRNKEEVDALFHDEEQKTIDMIEAERKSGEAIYQHEIKIGYTLNDFAILLVKTYNIQMLATYTISIEQIGTEDIFYLFARLHIDRYDRSNFCTKVPKKQ